MEDKFENAAAGRPGCLAQAADDAQRFECDIPSLCVQAHAANLDCPVLWNLLVVGRKLGRLGRRRLGGVAGQPAFDEVVVILLAPQQPGESLALHQELKGDKARARIIDLLEKVGIREAEKRLGAYPHQLFFPAAAISLTMFAFNFLGDGLRDALDPRLRT